MEIDGRVAVITQGLSEVALVLAERLSATGAAVVIADKNEKLLACKAAEIGVTAIAADMSQIGDIKNLVDKATRKFGRIDFFISTASFSVWKNCFMAKKDWDRYCQSDVMSQMYAAKYVLPQMINRKKGYLINMVPARGLLDEHCSDLYTTIKHPALSFAERMATAYHDKGIRVSVLCYDNLNTRFDNNYVISPHEAVRLDNLANLVISGIRREKFMIFSQTKKDHPVQSDLRLYEIYGAMRA